MHKCNLVNLRKHERRFERRRWTCSSTGSRGHHWCTGGAADAGSHASGNRHHANGRAGLSVVDSATQSEAASPGGGLWAASFRSRHPPRIGRAI